MLCFCGNSYAMYGRTNETECSSKCEDDPDTVCGGIERLSVYSGKMFFFCCCCSFNEEFLFLCFFPYKVRYSKNYVINLYMKHHI